MSEQGEPSKVLQLDPGCNTGDTMASLNIRGVNAEDIGRFNERARARHLTQGEFLGRLMRLHEGVASLVELWQDLPIPAERKAEMVASMIDELGLRWRGR